MRRMPMVCQPSTPTKKQVRRNAIASSNFASSASSAWDPNVEELYETCSGANDGPWRQSEVLQGSRVQLKNGFECAKENPTSVPTTREESSFIRCRSARAGGELKRNYPPRARPLVRSTYATLVGNGR